MFQPITSKQTGQQSTTRKRFNTPVWVILSIILGAVMALVVAPIMIPAIMETLSGPTPQAYWYVSRASAFVAYFLLWMSMLAGLGITGKLGRRWPGMPSSFEIHKFTSLLGLGFGTLHALILLGDQYMSYTLGQLLVPFMADSYRPQWVGLGQVAIYSLSVVAFSYYFRSRLGVRTWRLIHSLSFALFLMVLIHGLQSGTDSGNWWASALYWGSAASVLVGSIYRVISARAGHSKDKAVATGLVAMAGKAQTTPAMPMLYPTRMQPVPERAPARK